MHGLWQSRILMIFREKCSLSSGFAFIWNIRELWIDNDWTECLRLNFESKAAKAVTLLSITKS
jgi:hypothetical protein